MGAAEHRAAFLATGPAALGALPDLDAVLTAHLGAARAAWPQLSLDEVAFLGELGQICPDESALRGVRAADVFLARACAAGDQAAILTFEKVYFGEIDAAARSLRAGPEIAGEVKQMLRRVLFVAEETRRAATADYAGRGDLRGWIRVSAMREIVRLLKRAKRDVQLGDDRMLDLLSPGQDPELGYLRSMYQEAFAESFKAALAATPSDERSLLRYQLVDGLSIDQIGALYGVHRATAARRLARARDAILERTQAELASRVGATTDEVKSLIRLMQSRLDVSVERALGERIS